MSAWAYLLICSNGDVYLGATTHLRKRLRFHNSPNNTGYTKGRRWHLLAARRFETKKEAFDFERLLKRLLNRKLDWKIEMVERAEKIVARYGYSFEPRQWLRTKELRMARQKRVSNQNDPYMQFNVPSASGE